MNLYFRSLILVAFSILINNFFYANSPLLTIVIMVKNEEHVIKDTLLPYAKAGIDSFFVFDTGSTDNTLEEAKKFFDEFKVIGHIAQEPFIDFAASRNRALELAEKSFADAKFLLMPDAEWYMHNVEGLIEFCKKEQYKSTGLYQIRIVNQFVDFGTGRLFRNKSKVRFEDEVHEYAIAKSHDKVPADIYFKWNPSSKGNEKSKNRWNVDLEKLTKKYKKNPTDPRTVFYLGQTYECLDDLVNAYKYYKIRANMPGWDEENFITEYRLGRIAESLSKQNNFDFNWNLAMDHYLKAFSMRSHRIESLFRIADHYWPDNIPTCFLFAQYMYDVPYPSGDMLFIEKEIYEYARYEILSRCAWHMGKHELGEQATQKALKIHPEMSHLYSNLRCYLEKLNA